MSLILRAISLGLLVLSFVKAGTFDLANVIKHCEEQYELAVANLTMGKQFLADGHMDKWRISTNEWTDGFFTGSLWLLYEYTKKDIWRERAIHATDGMFKRQFITDGHDIGFMVMGSYGEGYRLTKNETYKPIIINAANHLAMRFNENVGMTRSWGALHDPKHFVVIVDNMMNLPLLYEASLLNSNKTLYHMAESHADRTMQSHIRHDYSHFHVVDFDQITGNIMRRYTAQGYDDHSCWSRGQAWLINGYMQSFKFTKYQAYLDIAINLASYFIKHLPEDGIPPWDFNVPHDAKHLYIPRDVSAGAIAAGGLFELYEATHMGIYLETAHKIIRSLTSNKYFIPASSKYHIHALLSNSTLAGPNADPHKSDLAVTFADYYMLKALGYLKKFPMQ